MDSQINIQNIIRSLPTYDIPIDKIELPKGIKQDEIYLAKYLRFVEGKKFVYITRLDISEILPGFYYKVDGDWQYHCDNDNNDEKDLRMVMDMIKAGTRPPVFVYKNKFLENKKWFCPDDVVLFRAYQNLSIQKVPVVMLDLPAKNAIKHSLIKVKVDQTSDRYHIKNLMPSQEQFVPALMSLESVSHKNSEEILLYLHERVSSLMEEVKNFHGESKDEIHYHHTLYSVLYRVNTFLDSIHLLLNKGLTHQAAILARPFYELVLNFYVDWLSPDIIGPYLKSISLIDNNKEAYALVFERMKEENEIQYQQWQEAYFSRAKFLKSIQRKAAINPLGEKFYEKYYRSFSKLIHQDFSVTSDFANTMKNTEEKTYKENEIVSLLQFIMLLVSQVVVCIGSDIGMLFSYDGSE